jgi:glyoxylase-like metal-dependent hydrolase (beta-lactamase superfamily II)
MVEPVPGLLVEVDGGYLLFDTGFNAGIVRDAPMYQRYWGAIDNHLPWAPLVELAGPPGQDPLPAAFALVGVDPADVVGVIVSHFHNDHSGGVRWFAGKAPVYVQRAEWEALRADPVTAESKAMHLVDVDDPRIDWRLADGDVELCPGVTAIRTAGHTPGHQSLVVERREADGGGGWVFAADAADLVENIEDEQPVSAWSGDPKDTIESIRRLKALAAERGLRLLPGHDPVVWPAFADELGVPHFRSTRT